MAFLSPEDYERIGHLEADIQAAKAEIEEYSRQHPLPARPAAGASQEAIDEWNAQTKEIEGAITQKRNRIEALQQELRSIN
jgi:chromosome segregation ATPase